MKYPGHPFTYGVAAYPEKHDEAPNIALDLQYLKVKQEAGAQYAVTQLFYDNSKFFTFVEQARAQGVTLPIIPGIKPFARLSQFTVVPKTFHCDLPEALAHEVLKCKTDEDAKQLGIAWGVEQCKGLYAAGVSNIHFYTVSAIESVYEIAKQLV